MHGDGAGADHVQLPAVEPEVATSITPNRDDDEGYMTFEEVALRGCDGFKPRSGSPSQEPKVGRLSAGGRRIRTRGPSGKGKAMRSHSCEHRCLRSQLSVPLRVVPSPIGNAEKSLSQERDRIRFRAQCEFCCERGAGLMVRIRFPPAESQRTFGSSRRAGFASGRTRTIERDTKGAKTRFIAPAYGKFESSSLLRRVNKLSVPVRQVKLTRSCR